jgi:hypothetical protein
MHVVSLAYAEIALPEAISKTIPNKSLMRRPSRTELIPCQQWQIQFFFGCSCGGFFGGGFGGAGGCWWGCCWFSMPLFEPLGLAIWSAKTTDANPVSKVTTTQQTDKMRMETHIG